MAKYIELNNGELQEVQPVSTSAGVGDAGKIIELDGTGKIDNSLLPTGVGAETKILPTSEDLSAGDLVNIYDNGGTITARKASASAIGTLANGFVLASTISPANATVYLSGINDQVTGLTGTTQWLSTTAGQSTSTPPTGAGVISQKIGTKLSATELGVEIAQPIVQI